MLLSALCLDQHRLHILIYCNILHTSRCTYDVTHNTYVDVDSVDVVGVVVRPRVQVRSVDITCDTK